MSKDEGLKLPQYNRYLLRKRLIFFILLVLTVLAALISASFGSMSFSLADVIKTLAGLGDDMAETVIMGIRLPRVVAAILVGAGLAVSGAVMQCVLRNPLASASTLGVSQGAAFGAALGIIVFGGGVINSSSAKAAIEINNPYIVTICAFVFGSMSTGVILGISRFKKSLGPGGLVLAGVALSSLFTGGSTLLQYFADETQAGAVVFWTFGNLGGTNWKEMGILFIILIIALTYFMLNRWSYNAMVLGADTAKSLGVNTRRVMLISMAICSLTAAASVSFVGIISFVGLIAPHMVRRFVGTDYRYLLPCSAVAGSLLLLLADFFGRSVIAPIVLPIGAITSFLGAPLFLILLFRGDKKNA